MFGSIPLAVQLPIALRISLGTSIVCGILIHDRIQHTRTLCFGLGASTSTVIVIARQVAKQASAAGGLHGSLWALVGLTALPTAFAALLFSRCIVGFLPVAFTVHTFCVADHYPLDTGNLRAADE